MLCSSASWSPRRLLIIIYLGLPFLFINILWGHLIANERQSTPAWPIFIGQMSGRALDINHFIHAGKRKMITLCQFRCVLVCLWLSNFALRWVTLSLSKGTISVSNTTIIMYAISCNIIFISDFQTCLSFAPLLFSLLINQFMPKTWRDWVIFLLFIHFFKKWSIKLIELISVANSRIAITCNISMKRNSPSNCCLRSRWECT